MSQKTPSMVMYAAFKQCGISNHDAATVLLNTRLTFDGRMLQERIEESSQLSRRIVRTSPGELSIGLFNDFNFTCPRLANLLVENLALKDHRGNAGEASEALSSLLATTYARSMAGALSSFGIDAYLYRNMVSYFDHVELERESDRAVLHVMLFTITGCIGDPKAASLLTMEYAATFLGVDYQTAPTIIGNASQAGTAPEDASLGLMRIENGYIKAGARMHVLSPDGTEIGLLPQAKHTVSDVGKDVSRRHALIWRQDGKWLLRDLGSTNGTRITSGSSGEVSSLDPDGTPLEVHPTDVISLGTTTSFLVMPILGA